MRRKSSVLAAAAAAFVGLTAAPAAALPLTITPLGPVTFANVEPVQAINLATGSVLDCDTSVLQGNVTSAGLGIHTASFSTPGNPVAWCDGPAGTYVKVTATYFTWRFKPLSYISGMGVTYGEFSDVRATLHGSDECDATIGGWGASAGVIEATYSNTTNVLRLWGGNLAVRSADADCDPVLINVGDQVELTGAYEADPPLTISPP